VHDDQFTHEYVINAQIQLRCHLIATSIQWLDNLRVNLLILQASDLINHNWLTGKLENPSKHISRSSQNYWNTCHFQMSLLYDTMQNFKSKLHIIWEIQKWQIQGLEGQKDKICACVWQFFPFVSHKMDEVWSWKLNFVWCGNITRVFNDSEFSVFSET